jgi:hypothetical protein
MMYGRQIEHAAMLHQEFRRAVTDPAAVRQAACDRALRERQHAGAAVAAARRRSRVWFALLGRPALLRQS